MKKILLVVLFSALLALTADDACWVNGTFQWEGSGTICTQAFPVFGNDLRIAFSSASHGDLKVILVDASDAMPLLPNQKVVDTKRLAASASRSYTGYRMAYLLITGSLPWDIRADQYMDTVQEWRLKTYQEKEAAKTRQKLGVWADQGAAQLPFTSPASSWSITVTAQADAALQVTVAEEGKTPYFRQILYRKDQTVTGWIHSKKPVTISVRCAQDVAWEIQAVAE